MSRAVARTFLACLVVLALAAVAAVVVHRAGRGPFVDPQSVNRFSQAPPWVDPASTAAQWVAGAGAGTPAEVLATTAAGVWITPEQHPVDSVAAYVAKVVAEADDDGAAPVLVVYGIPQRDCVGQLSGGGTTVEGYLPWVRAIVSALSAGRRPVVVLEPDALATADDCGLLAQRTDLLREAVGTLAAAGITTYVDAGHSSWVPAGTMAERLAAVGVDRVRGFSTNVANFQTTADEVAYADTLVEALPGSSYVVDTGRNGNGATTDWCNPPGRALGDRPGYVDDGTPLDALLWIKPPGESDGTCGGGPAAGTFWPERAVALAQGAS